MADYGRVATAAVVVAADASDDRGRVATAALVVAADAPVDRGRVATMALVALVGPTQPPPTLVDTGRAGHAVHWLLELELGDRLYRFGVDEVDVVRDDGTTLRFLAGLHSLELRRGTEGPPTAAIVLDDVVDWALLVARGVDVHSGTATLLRWYEDELYEEARVMLRGRVSDPDYGGPGEPLTFTLDFASWREPRLVPPPAATIDARTWPITTSFEPDANIIGSCYPWVFGTPGSGGVTWGALGTPLTLTAPATPAYIAEYGGGAHNYRSSKLVICDGTWGVGATTVTVVDVTNGYRESPTAPAGAVSESALNVTTTTDLLGRTVSYVDWNTPGTYVILIPGNEYWIQWDDGGGILRADQSGPITGAGEVIEFLLDQADAPYSKGRVAAARAKLDRFRLDFAIVEPTTVEDWIEQELGAILPLIRRDGPDGFWYELFPYDATEQDVVAHLVVNGTAAGIRVEREGPVRWTPLEDVANEIVLDYAASRGDRFLQRKIITGFDEADVLANELLTYRCRISHHRYGRRTKQIETRLVWDPPTATAILAAQAAMHALPRRIVELAGGVELDTIEPGAVVAVTDDDLYLDREIGVVVETVVGLAGVALTVELLDDPVRRQRETT